MGAIQLPDDLHRAIEEQVALGRAASAADFIAEAVARMIQDDEAEQSALDGDDGAVNDELEAVITAGLAEAEAGQGILISSPDDAQRLQESFVRQLREDLAAGQ
ncbi:MAG: hypothetical protein U1E70_20230 [Acetobacteraceae bacterium]|nr:hypothetical protein [Pseudomonadota bacterium]